MRNAKLQKYIDINAQIARLEKEKEAIKEEILEVGSFETSMFVVEVTKVNQTRTIDANELCAVLDPVLVAEKNLLKKVSFKKVSVKKKDLAVA